MGLLFKISGPVVIAEGMRGSKINDLVRIGDDKLLGEIIALKGENATIQVYEETTGLKPGDPVENTGEPLSVLLGPGLLSNVYDGIQRPLRQIEEERGIYITRGVNVPSIDLNKKFEFTPLVKKGSEVKVGQKLGYFQELNIKHYVVSKLHGKITSIEEGKIALKTPVAVIGKEEVYGYEKWPVRKARNYKLKLNLETPLITGKRIIDSFFPLSKGGTAAIPGPFGSGKCITGETPVLTSEGLKEIKQVYEENKKEAFIEKNYYEELVYLKKPIKLYSMKEGKIIESESKTMFKTMSDSVIEVTTRSGKQARVTPIHKLFKFDENMNIVETESRLLKKGDYIAGAEDTIFEEVLNNSLTNSGNQLLLSKSKLKSKTTVEVISGLEEIKGPFEVYDFVVPELQNFVGGFGGLILHNSVNQQDLAKYSDADIIVYIGCGERGNEMTEVLTEFPHLKDPRTGKPLMDRTVLVANTSNMPVAAREASIYTGITIAEYYRDMGYDVALMADSTSRWAEAMREISGRLEEMPGEEGYPAYLSRKLAEFYERAGRVECLDGKTIGSVSVVGAVSPPGGDISEPVSQATLRITKAFWALDASLSRRRHYPAINWLKSYSLYAEVLTPWYQENVSKEFMILREKALKMLQREAELQNIIQLVGPDSLPDKERLLLEFTRSLREDFLQQNSFDEVDCYTNLKKQFLMLKLILTAYEKFDVKLSTGTTLEELLKNEFFKKCARFKFEVEKTLEEDLKKIEKG